MRRLVRASAALLLPHLQSITQTLPQVPVLAQSVSFRKAGLPEELSNVHEVIE
jgi:hypothetical protein